MIVEAAPAKINLTLRVVGRRADGYHLLDSLAGFADIGDVVAAEPAAGLSLAIDGPFAAGLSAGPDNLVLRAAHALAAAAGRAPGAALRLTKNLPVASGIGGGSADAAAALRALVRLWRLDLPRQTLAGIAAGLGADVPACLDSQANWMSGIGEILEPAGELPESGVLLANPGIALATPAVFKRREGPFSAAARFAIPADSAGLIGLLAGSGNDLTHAAKGLVPEIGTLLAALEALPGAGLARMSGSGASCFALFADRDAAFAAAARLRASAPAGWWIAAGGWHKPPHPAVVRSVRGC